jgi:hypothetical protein
MSDDEEADPRPLATASVTVNVTDLLGLGRAAKSEAAKALVQTIQGLFKSVYRSADVYLSGIAKNAVASDAITSGARAKTEAALIEQAGRELLDRASRRFVAIEVAKQVNLEHTVEKAVEALDKESPAATQRPIDEGWLLAWLDGAQSASSDQIREMWARILAAEAQAEKRGVSRASVSLLSLLDEKLAKSFEHFVLMLNAYGGLPLEAEATAGFDQQSLNLLAEIGLITRATASELYLEDFSLSFESSPIKLPFSHMGLTHRGFEIAEAVFGNPVDPGRLRVKRPTQTEFVNYLAEMVSALVRNASTPLVLDFGRPRPHFHPTLLVVRKLAPATEARRRRDLFFEGFDRPFSAVTKEFVARIDEWFEVGEISEP